jgi:phosphatidylethanolamine/phosphatidyl-N-methylethanolamine N-methyltransferase
MNDHTLFVRKFLRHGTKIASIAPSSQWLARATVRNVDWEKANVIVELGAGTGPITRVIAEKVRPETRVIVLEHDPDFAKLLAERFGSIPNFDVIEGDALDLKAMLADRGLAQVDHIISGLPIPSFSTGLQRDLFRVVHEILVPSGGFSQITELALVYWPLYKRFFDRVMFVFEPRNLPPAGAYHCWGVKAPA